MHSQEKQNRYSTSPQSFLLFVPLFFSVSLISFFLTVLLPFCLSERLPKRNLDRNRYETAYVTDKQDYR